MKKIMLYKAITIVIVLIIVFILSRKFRECIQSYLVAFRGEIISDPFGFAEVVLLLAAVFIAGLVGLQQNKILDRQYIADNYLSAEVRMPTINEIAVKNTGRLPFKITGLKLAPHRYPEMVVEIGLGAWPINVSASKESFMELYTSNEFLKPDLQATARQASEKMKYDTVMFDGELYAKSHDGIHYIVKIVVSLYVNNKKEVSVKGDPFLTDIVRADFAE